MEESIDEKSPLLTDRCARWNIRNRMRVVSSGNHTGTECVPLLSS